MLRIPTAARETTPTTINNMSPSTARRLWPLSTVSLVRLARLVVAQVPPFKLKRQPRRAAVEGPTVLLSGANVVVRHGLDLPVAQRELASR